MSPAYVDQKLGKKNLQVLCYKRVQHLEQYKQLSNAKMAGLYCRAMDPNTKENNFISAPFCLVSILYYQ